MLHQGRKIPAIKLNNAVRTMDEIYFSIFLFLKFNRY